MPGSSPDDPHGRLDSRVTSSGLPESSASLGPDGPPPGDLRPLRVAVLHPDLGLGGAERLIVDACVELSRRGHAVDLYTAHHDPARCFPETLSGQFRVLVRGAWFPRALLGRLLALCAWVRCALVALS